MGHDDIRNSARTENVAIRHNFFDLHRPDIGGRGRLIQISNGAYDIRIEHNTGSQDMNVIWTYDLPTQLFRFTNNLSRHNVCAAGTTLCGIAGGGTAVGDATIAQYFPGGVFRQNVMFGGGGSPASYTNNQLCSIDGFPAAVAFDSDGSLAAGSPYAGRGIADAGCGGDGLDVGADMATVNALTDRAVLGIAPPTPSTSSPLDVDGDLEVKPFTDGVLMLRWLFGIRGEALVAGAVDRDCGFCAPADVQARLGALDAMLDVDRDEEVEPLTDGVLVLRYLLGIRGDVLTEGAVGASCDWCDAEAIVPYLESML